MDHHPAVPLDGERQRLQPSDGRLGSAQLTALGELAHTEVVVAEHRLCAPLLDEIPRAIRIGTLVEDVTDKDHARGLGLLKQMLEFGGAAVHVADDERPPHGLRLGCEAAAA